jgi:(R)-2-hydroxyglutarate---pyruvate transhydrogenase
LTLDELNGSISAEHGLGFAKNKYLKYSKSALDIEYMRRIKKVFDPKGIMNPYKYLPPTEDV